MFARIISFGTVIKVRTCGDATDKRDVSDEHKRRALVQAQRRVSTYLIFGRVHQLVGASEVAKVGAGERCVVVFGGNQLVLVKDFDWFHRVILEYEKGRSNCMPLGSIIAIN